MFRVFRLNHGVYGQRQGGHNQMLRVKIPHGRVTPEQLEMFAYIAETYSRGWGHLTTRQNVQFHFVQLEQTPEILRLMASVGLTSREACGDTVRNVMGCHLAGACPQEVLDITPWAEATTDFFLRHPYAQRLPRKFKINFSGCATDCGQAMFNDVGVIAIDRARSPTARSRPASRCSSPAASAPTRTRRRRSRSSRPAKTCSPPSRRCLRTFDHYGNRDNKIRARMKWLVDTMGIDELRERIIKERKFLRGVARLAGRHPRARARAGDAPAGGASIAPDRSAIDGVPGEAARRASPTSGGRKPTSCAASPSGTVSAMAYARLGDITTDQFRGARRDPARLPPRRPHHQPPELRAPRPHRGRPAGPLRPPRRDRHGRARRRARPRRRGVPRRRHLQPRGHAVAWSRGGDRRRARGRPASPRCRGVRVNISGCTNSCGQHHIADIGFFGLERRAHGRAAPGYQMLLGGHVGDMQIEFGEKATKLPAKTAPEAVVRVVGRFDDERQRRRDVLALARPLGRRRGRRRAR